MQGLTRAVYLIIAFFSCIATTIIMLAAITQISIHLLPERLSGRIKYELYGKHSEENRYFNENARSYSDHDAVFSWVLRCVKGDDYGPVPRQMDRFSNRPSILRVYDTGDQHQSDSSESLDQEDYKILSLSHSVYFDRQFFEVKKNKSYLLTQTFEIAIILIGMTTTILISISSTNIFDQSSKLAKLIKVGAVVFPAIGTAVAATNSLYSPREEMGRATHAFAALSQLHNQMVVELWNMPCASKQKDEDKKRMEAKLGEWIKRYQDIATSMNAATNNANARTQPPTAPMPSTAQPDGGGTQTQR